MNCEKEERTHTRMIRLIKRRGNGVSENLRQSESVQTSHLDLLLEGNHETMCCYLAIHIPSCGQTLQETTLDDRFPKRALVPAGALYRGGATSACRSPEGMAATGQGAL